MFCATHHPIAWKIFAPKLAEKIIGLKIDSPYITVSIESALEMLLILDTF